MAEPLSARLAQERAKLEALGRWRTRPEPTSGIDFCSNDYLGLARDPRVVAAAREALEEHGAGGRAARLLGGGGPWQGRAEVAAARWLGAEDALLFPSGYQANLGLLAALVSPGDSVLSDALVHASWIDAIRLARARRFIHAHGDLGSVEQQLRAARHARTRFLVTEGIFSMDGDRPDLIGLHDLCVRYDAWLIVDEAHSAGLLGAAGAGAVAEAGLSAGARLLARIVTGGKALGAGGALIAGTGGLIEHLVQRARGFVFTTAPPPAVAAALFAGIELAAAADDERTRVLGHARLLAELLGTSEPDAAIVPLVLGSETAAIDAAGALNAAGFDVRPVRPPTVPAGASRLRLVTHAHNTDAEVRALAAALSQVPRERTALATLPLVKPKTLGQRTLAVIGTDTGIGKTVVSALAVAACARLGPVSYWKPVQTGEESDTRTVAGLVPELARDWPEPLRHYPLPASPHTAAAAAGEELPHGELGTRLEAWRRDHPEQRLVMEFAGGLLVPYSDDRTQADWIAELRPSVLLVARAGLGTLNHTLLTVEALAARHLAPACLVLVGEHHPANESTLARRLPHVPVLSLPWLDPVSAQAPAAQELIDRLREVLEEHLP